MNAEDAPQLGSEDGMQTAVTIDGSMLEGGGQILRNSAALAAITNKVLTVTKIRAGRSKPGLAAQHLAGLQLVQAVSQGSLEGGNVRSSGITLTPRVLKCGQYTADVKTAGSVSLLVQTVLPTLLFARPSMSTDQATGGVPCGECVSHVTSHVTLRGGTDAALAPPISYVTGVLAPLLRHLFGDVMDFKVDLVRRGFYPRGGGEVRVTARCLPEATPLPACNLTQFGHVTSVHVHAFTAGRVADSVGRAMAEAAAAGMRRAVRVYGRQGLLESAPLAPVTSAVEREGTETAEGDGGGVSIVVHTSTGCILGANALAEKGEQPDSLGKRCAQELEDAMAGGACVDAWMQDQLIIWMALANGTSSMLCCEPSLHCRTAMVVAEALTTARFTVTRPGSKGGPWRVECKGAGLVRTATPG